VEGSGRIWYHLVRWVPLLATAVVAYLLFPPPTGQVAVLPSVGQVAGRTIVAPFGYQVRKSPEEIAREGESRALGAQPVFRYSPTAYDSALTAARAFFAELERAQAQGPELLRAVAATRVSLGPDETAYLTDAAQRQALQETVTHFLAEALSRGVADAGVVRGEPSPTVTLRRGDQERVLPRDSILTFADLMEQAEAAGTGIDSPVGQRTLRRLVAAFYQPTIVPDLPLTTARREQLRGSVDPIKYSVGAGEVLTSAGQPVTEEARAKLAVLQQEIVRRGAEHLRLRSAIGVLLHNALLLAAFWLLIAFYRKETYQHPREMAFFGALFSLVLLMTAGLYAVFPGRPELVPIPFAIIVITLLYNGRIGVTAAVILAVLLDGQWALRSSDILFFGVVSGVAGAVAIRVVRRRRHLYLTIGMLALAGVLASVTIGLINGWPTVTIVASAALGVLMAPPVPRWR